MLAEFVSLASSEYLQERRALNEKQALHVPIRTCRTYRVRHMAPDLQCAPLLLFVLRDFWLRY
jgi:hypothetical protein